MNDPNTSRQDAVLRGAVERILRQYLREPPAPSLDEVRRLATDLEQKRRTLEEENQALRKRQQQLEAYRDRYLDLYDFAPLGYLTLDEDGYLQEINLSGARLLGLDREELIGYPFADHVAKEDRGVFLEHVRRCAVERQEVTSEVSLVDRQGSPTAVQLHSMPVETPERDETFCKTAVTDLRQSKEAAQALRLAEERLRLAVEAAKMGPWHWDLVTRRLEWSAACKALFQLPPDAPVSYQRFLELLHPDDRARIDAEVRRALEEKTDYDVEFRTLGPEGTIRHLASRGRGFYDAAGRLLRMEGMVYDITDHKQAEEALRASERRYATLAQEAPIGIFETDASGDGLFVNRRWCEIAGMTPEAALGRGWLAAIHPEDRARVQAEWYAAAEVGREFALEYRFQTPQGKITQVLGAGKAKTNERGEVIGYLGTIQDVTARRQAEEQLRALNAALENRVVERTAAAAECEAQLGAMASELSQAEESARRRLAQFLHDQLQQLLDRARRKAARQVQGERLDALLAECLVESGFLTTEPSPPGLHETGLAAGLAWLAQEMQRKHGLRVVWEADQQADPQDDSTRGLLFQAVRVLLLSAITHVQADRVSVKLTRTPDQQIRIEVRDEGLGLDRSEVESPGGFEGLDLSGIRERLESLGGRLEVDTGPGAGTQVILLAPLSPSRPAASAEGPQVAAGASNKPPRLAAPRRPAPVRVLLADDHPILRRGLADLMRQRPEIELVGEASDGQETVEMALRIHPDVVLMDVTMPKVSGIEATRRITEELPQVRVIGLSMYEGEELAAAMQKAGAAGYLSKSDPSSALIAAILEPAPSGTRG